MHLFFFGLRFIKFVNLINTVEMSSFYSKNHLQVQNTDFYDEKDKLLYAKTSRLFDTNKNPVLSKGLKLFERKILTTKRDIFFRDGKLIFEVREKLYNMLLEVGILDNNQVDISNMEIEYSVITDRIQVQNAFEALNISFKLINEILCSVLDFYITERYYAILKQNIHYLKKGHEALCISLSILVNSVIKSKHDKRNNQAWDKTTLNSVYTQIITYLNAERFYIELFMQILVLDLRGSTNYRGNEENLSEILIYLTIDKFDENIETYFKLNIAIVESVRVIIRGESWPLILRKREIGLHSLSISKIITQMPNDLKILFIRNVHHLLSVLQKPITELQSENSLLIKYKNSYDCFQSKSKRKFIELYNLVKEYSNKFDTLFSKIDRKIHPPNYNLINRNLKPYQNNLLGYITSKNVRDLFMEIKDLNTHIINIFRQIFGQFSTSFILDPSLLLLGGFIIEKDTIVQEYSLIHVEYIKNNTKKDLDNFKRDFLQLKIYFERSKTVFECFCSEKNFYITSFAKNLDASARYNTFDIDSNLVNKTKSLLDHFLHESLSYHS